jgi:hypothetical protein
MMKFLMAFLILSNLSSSLASCYTLANPECYDNYKLQNQNTDFLDSNWSIKGLASELNHDNSSIVFISSDDGSSIGLDELELERLNSFVNSMNNYTNQKDDKKAHSMAGNSIAFMAQGFCDHSARQNSAGLSLEKSSFLCGLGAASLVGVLKELYDSTGRGHVELEDAVATGIGGFYIRYQF